MTDKNIAQRLIALTSDINRLITESEKISADVNQSWETETTVFYFSDGSALEICNFEAREVKQ